MTGYSSTSKKKKRKSKNFVAKRRVINRTYNYHRGPQKKKYVAKSLGRRWQYTSTTIKANAVDVGT